MAPREERAAKLKEKVDFRAVFREYRRNVGKHATRNSRVRQKSERRLRSGALTARGR